MRPCGGETGFRGERDCGDERGKGKGVDGDPLRTTCTIMMEGDKAKERTDDLKRERKRERKGSKENERMQARSTDGPLCLARSLSLLLLLARRRRVRRVQQTSSVWLPDAPSAQQRPFPEIGRNTVALQVSPSVIRSALSAAQPQRHSPSTTTPTCPSPNPAPTQAALALGSGEIHRGRSSPLATSGSRRTRPLKTTFGSTFSTTVGTCSATPR